MCITKENLKLNACCSHATLEYNGLNNREAKRELKFYNNGRLLPFCPTPTYFWGKTGQIAEVSSPSIGIAQKHYPRASHC